MLPMVNKEHLKLATNIGTWRLVIICFFIFPPRLFWVARWLSGIALAAQTTRITNGQFKHVLLLPGDVYRSRLLFPSPSSDTLLDSKHQESANHPSSSCLYLSPLCPLTCPTRQDLKADLSTRCCRCDAGETDRGRVAGVCTVLGGQCSHRRFLFVQRHNGRFAGVELWLQ